jgi:hypothetical protein
MFTVIYGSKTFILSNDTAYGLMVQASKALQAGKTAKAKALVAKAVKAEG